MATERFANGAQTTLADPINNSATVLTVASAALFPGTGDFRVRIGDELLVVTAVAGTAWTVTRGAESTTAAAHAAGTAVVQVLTAGVMNALGALASDQSANGVFAGPSSGGAAAPAFRALVTADLPNAGVTDAKLRTSAAASVIGRATGTSGAPADVAAALGSGAGVLAFSDTGDTVEWKQGSGLPVLDGGAVSIANAPLAYGGTGASLTVPGADRVLFWDESAGQVTWLTVGSGLSVTGTTLAATGSGGTVTSVALSAPSFLSVSGSPVTGSGTLALSLATQSANGVFAGPSSGGAAAPAFRALVTADLPDAGVTDAKLRASAGMSVVGRAANSIGAPADITAAADGEVLRRSGTDLGFGTVSTNGLANGAVTDAKLRDGAATSVVGRAANSTGVLGNIAASTDGQFLRRASGALAFGAIATGDLPSAVTGAVVPTGAIMAFARSSAPTGWLVCDGGQVLRATYADLFAAIGTTWGAGDGSTTFNVPNFQRRVAVGSGGTGTGTLGNAVGNTGGAETHTLSATEIPSHTHSITGVNDAVAIRTATGTGFSWPAGGNGLAAVPNASGATGGGGAHNNVQPSAVVLYCIKT